MQKLLVILFATCFVGCSTTIITEGINFNDLRVDEIVRNKTTASDILAMFGQPFQKAVTDTGETWTYQYGRYKDRGQTVFQITTVEGYTMRKLLTVRFDTSRVVREYSYTSSGNNSGVIGFTLAPTGEVLSIDNGGAAQKAGIKNGDRILKINGYTPPFGDNDAMRQALAGRSGERIDFIVERDGKQYAYTVFRR